MSLARCNKRVHLQIKRKMYCIGSIGSECAPGDTQPPRCTKPTPTLYWQGAVTQDPLCSSASTFKIAAFQVPEESVTA